MTVQSVKIVTVFGGTGCQGSSVVRSILAAENRPFCVRVITRDPTSEKALAMAAIGAELIQADGFNHDQMIHAFQDSWGAFVNTNSDDEALKSLDGPSDYDLGAAVLDAAEAAGVSHVVYSSGPSIVNATKGRIHLEGFETKYHVEQYGRHVKKFTTFTSVICASFMECFLSDAFVDSFGGFPWYPTTETGDLVFRTPPYGGKGDMPWLSVENDLGDIIHGIFLEPTKYDKILVQATSQQITMTDLAATYTKGDLTPTDCPKMRETKKGETAATGIKCRYEEMASWKDIKPNGTRCREETRLIFWMMNSCGGRWFAEHESNISASVELKRAGSATRGPAEELTSFAKWFKTARVLKAAQN